MKFEFSMTSKVNPVADVNISVDCSTEELGIMLSDPAYQKIAEVLITKLQQAQANHAERRQRRQRDHRQANQHQDALRNLNKLRKVVEKSSKQARRYGSFAEAFGDAVKEARRNWGELD